MDTREFVKALGSTTSAAYTEVWNQNNATNILRTNNAAQGNVPVINNSWTTNNGTSGSYTVGPVGKYRYLALYNWSASCNVSEWEIYSVENTSTATEDTELSAAWTDDDDTLTGISQPVLKNHPIVAIGSTISCTGAKHLQVYALNGICVASVNGSAVTAVPGLYIVRAVWNNQTIVQKVIVRK
jgi:hypothetical protein